jgi:hypothetical protein
MNGNIAPTRGFGGGLPVCALSRKPVQNTSYRCLCDLPAGAEAQQKNLHHVYVWNVRQVFWCSPVVQPCFWHSRYWAILGGQVTRVGHWGAGRGAKRTQWGTGTGRGHGAVSIIIMIISTKAIMYHIRTVSITNSINRSQEHSIKNQ